MVIDTKSLMILGVGSMILIFGGVSRFCTWVLYFKDYNRTIHISSEKRKFKHFWQLAPQQTENSTFSGKLIKNHKFHGHKVRNEKITEPVVILFYIISA